MHRAEPAGELNAWSGNEGREGQLFELSQDIYPSIIGTAERSCSHRVAPQEVRSSASERQLHTVVRAACSALCHDR
jgi:hypothetical protein